MNQNNYDINDDTDALTLKYQTLDDFMNNSPLSNIDQNLVFSYDDTELQFNKPIFDMAFIITNKSLIEKLNGLQTKFQSKYGFTTHSIFLPDIDRLNCCIRDLKLHKVIYALVLTDSFLSENIMDAYVLFPIIEIQKEMTITDVLDLVDQDNSNLIQTIKQLRAKGNPHPLNSSGKEMFNMNDELRYHMCLLSDHRMLSMKELVNLKVYLEFRKTQMEKAVVVNPDIFVDRPLEACRQERLKYYIYEPIIDNVTPNVSNRIPDVQRNLIKFNVSSSQSTAPTVLPPSIQYPGHHTYETPVINRAKTIINDFGGYLQQFRGIQICRGIVKPMHYEILQGRVMNKQVSKKNDSECIKYTLSDYWVEASLCPENQDVISLSSGSCTPVPMEYDLIAITPPSPRRSPAKVELGKRKSESHGQVNTDIVSKSFKPGIETSTPLKNTPDILINLFRFILNVAPYELPNNNALHTMLTAECGVVQNGIIEPNLKNVNIDIYSCKTNGTVEIIQSIYSIYEVTEKNVEDLPDLQYVWTKYFPEHPSSLSLLIVFYKFIKLLIIYGIFNDQSDRLQIIIDAVEKINAVINFNFEIPILSENEHLNFVSDLFNRNYKNHDKLHSKYFNLPHLGNIPSSGKKLDFIIKKKKIEFVVGPLLTYFVNTINTIHKKMHIQQTKIVYNAMRTLRYCLREIYPINSPTTVFNAYRAFNDSHECFKDIKEEAKWLLDELKYYVCVLFTEKHYDFMNCLLDFCLRIEEAVTNSSDESRSLTSNEPLFVLNPVQFIESFASYEGFVLQYHPESEISYWKGYLKSSWIKILQKAFQETSLKYEGRPIIKEINNLLPSFWGLKTFDEAVIEAARLNSVEWISKAKSDRSGWSVSFKKVKLSGITWLNSNQLPLTKAGEEFRKYENMLRNEFLCQ